MSKPAPSNFAFRLSVGLPLLAVAFGAWYLSAYSFQASSSMAMGSSSPVAPIATMASMFSAPDVGIVFAFLAVWIVGMIAMMFPAMIPVVSFYSGMKEEEETQRGTFRFLGPFLFLCGYLVLYAALGLGLFSAVYAAFQLGSLVPWLSSLSIVSVAGVLVVTGVWQLTPLKEKTLAKCVSPMGFFMTHFKKGPSGALRMGAEHGVYCVGCCWLYMLVMLAVAAMSLVSMVLLSVLIIVEKAFIGKSSWFRWVSAGLFFSLAATIVIVPSYLAYF